MLALGAADDGGTALEDNYHHCRKRRACRSGVLCVIALEMPGDCEVSSGVYLVCWPSRVLVRREQIEYDSNKSKKMATLPYNPLPSPEQPVPCGDGCSSFGGSALISYRLWNRLASSAPTVLSIQSPLDISRYPVIYSGIWHFTPSW